MIRLQAPAKAGRHRSCYPRFCLGTRATLAPAEARWRGGIKCRLIRVHLSARGAKDATSATGAERRVPFSFQLHGQMLPAGQYLVTSDSNGVVEIEGVRGAI